MLLEIARDPEAPGRITVRGEVDVSTAAQLREAIRGEFERGADDLMLDATALTFMDASGLHLLIEAAKIIRGELVLVNATPIVRRVLEVSGIEGMTNLRVVTS